MLDKSKRAGWLARKLKTWRNVLADRILRRVEQSPRSKWRRGKELLKRFEREATADPRRAAIDTLRRNELIRFLQEEAGRSDEELRQVREERDEFEKQVEKLWRDFTRFMQSNAELGNLVMDWMEAIKGIDELRIDGRKIIERAENVAQDFREKYGRKEAQATQAVEATAEAFNRGRLGA